jgi:2-polyprenyl-6-methoxyphenol hydroxylase-like FAD-dependent oxidoreductase
MLDVAVIGGGIIGLATAHALRIAGLDVAVLEIGRVISEAVIGRAAG